MRVCLRGQETNPSSRKRSYSELFETRFEPVADKVLAELDQIALSVDGAAGVSR